MSDFRVLVVNPGSTSTRLALFVGERCEAEELVVVHHRDGDLAHRVADALSFLQRRGEGPLHAVVGRGGLLAPVRSGTIRVDDSMLEDGRRAARGDHPSNLGCLIAHAVADRYRIPAFVVDPVSVDEMLADARVTGLPHVRRESLSHALNLHAVARRAAVDLEIEYSTSRFVVAHLGGGFSIAAMRGGRILDTSNANSGGPFSPTRAGALPTQALIRMCFSGRFTLDDIKRLTTKEGGLRAHLGTSDAVEIERRIESGDVHAREVYDAMAYHTAKEIAAMAAVLRGRLHAVVLTGGLAHSERFCKRLWHRITWLGPMLRYPGEFEMHALASGALRVLGGHEAAVGYPGSLVGRLHAAGNAEEPSNGAVQADRRVDPSDPCEE